jgi:hypothetical protein
MGFIESWSIGVGAILKGHVHDTQHSGECNNTEFQWQMSCKT